MQSIFLRYIKTLIFLITHIIVNNHTTSLKKDFPKKFLVKKTNNSFQERIVWKNSIKNKNNIINSNLHLGFSRKNIFFANQHGIIKSIDINSGKKIWETDLSMKTKTFSFHKKSAQLSSGITSYKDCIYIGSELAKLYSLKSKNGHVIWETTLSGEILSDPVVTNTMILVHSNVGMLHAINKKDGSIKWTTSLGINPPINLRGESKPVVISNFIIIGDKNGYINILDINSGRILWKKYIIKNKDCNGSIEIYGIKSTITIRNNVAYIADYSNNFMAIDLISKRELWHKKIGSTIDFFTDQKNIYIIDNIDHIFSINLKNGKLIWSQSMLLNKHLTSPSIYNNKYIILGDYYGNLYWINSNNGLIEFKKKISNSNIIFKPIIISKKIIVQTQTGEIYALE